MKIVNPLYDTAFKYLMENNKLAKKVLSVILDTEIIELSVGQQETAVRDDKRRLALFRLDFKAVIKDVSGERKKVLIELQKSKYPTDIQRFRAYLGTNYLKNEDDGNHDKAAEETVKYKSSLPIVTIYILGYNLEDLPYLAVTVNNDIINSVNKKKINTKCFFVEQLTHKAHIIQIRRLPEKRRTRLENFLTLFNQAWCTDYDFIIDLQDINEEFKDIARYLQVPVMDEDFHRRLMAEEEIDFIFDEQEAKYLRKIEEIERQKEEIERQKEEEKDKKENMAVKLAARMKKTGANIEDIVKETGLPERQIRKL